MNWFTLAFISALLSACAAIMQKKTLLRQGALKFSFLLSLMNLMLSVPFLFITRFSSLTPFVLFILFSETVLSAASFLFVMLSLKNLEISKALPLMVLSPGLAALISFFLMGETIRGRQLSGLFLLALGCLVLEIKEEGNFSENVRSMISLKNKPYVFCAMILMAISSVADRFLLKNYGLHPDDFMFFKQLFYAIDYSLILLLFPRSGQKSLPQGRVCLAIFFIAILTLTYRYAQLSATAMAPVALVLAIKRTSVLFATIIGGRMFHEHFLLKRTLATILLVAGAILIA